MLLTTMYHFSVCEIEKQGSDVQKEGDAGVGHGVCQTQNPTSHNGIAKIEDRHAERGLPFKLMGKKKV